MEFDLQNQRLATLVVRGADGARLTLAPLEKRTLTDKELAPFDRTALTSGNKVRIVPVPETGSHEWIPGFLGAAFFVGLMGGAIVNDNAPHLIYWYWGGAVLLALAAIVVVYFWMTGGKERLMTWVVQAVSLVFILLVGIGLPALSTDQLQHAKAVFSADSESVDVGSVVRFFQFLFLVVVILLPALLYYTFDRQQLSTLRERFYRDALRLDPNLEDLTAVRAKYGQQIEEVYGPDNPYNGGRLTRGTRWPILLATVIIALGWIFTLPTLARIPGTASSPADPIALLTPVGKVMAFGFLGAYFFSLNMILRRYMRGDLKPKAYGHISARVLIVFILSWVLDMLYQGGAAGPAPWVLGAAFLAGIVPETFVTLIQETVRRRWPKGIFPTLEEKHPLTNLDGIDLYDRARLQEEGVANIEGLAHHDLIDLILETRIPVARLVDWVDQSILYLHVPADAAAGEGGTAGAGALTRDRFLACGIRTAAEFQCVVRCHAEERAAAGAAEPEKEALARLYEVLAGREAKSVDGDDVEVVRLRVLMTALCDDDWLPCIRHWRASSDLEKREEEIDADGSARSAAAVAPAASVLPDVAVPAPDPAPQPSP